MKYFLALLAYLIFAVGFLQGQTPTPSPTPTIVSKLTVAWDKSPDPLVVGYVLYASQTAPTGTPLKFASPLSFNIPGSTTVSYTFTNLTDGTYFLAITAKNGAGLESTYSNVIQASIQSQPPPAPTGLKITSQNASPLANRVGFNIQWKTNFPSKGKLLYGQNAANLRQSVKDEGGWTTDHQLKVTGLKRGMTYAYQIVATGKDGLHGISQPATVRLP
jgi:hypothetical protein